MQKETLKKLEGWPSVVLVAFILAGASYYSYQRFSILHKEKAVILAELGSSLEENYKLILENREKQAIIDSFGGQIQNIGNTVGTLEKLAKTDPELLNKYSKVYFLNENYVPEALAEIEEKYAYSDNGNYLVHTEVWPLLKRLLEAARADGIELLIASAFRSFDTQAALKAGYTVTYGSGANQFSADQGYSEHQLGTSVDFTTPEVGAVFSKFSNDDAYKWLLDNAYKYGFVLSYPKGNSYYKFEPWHWRFVSVSLATHLHNEGKYFYDLSQREIDAYLVKLFD